MYYGYGVDRCSILPFGPLYNSRANTRFVWHSPHYHYSEVHGGTQHLPNSRYPPYDVYKTPWLCHIYPTHFTPGEPDWWA